MAECLLHPAICANLALFAYDDLPEHLAEVAAEFDRLAHLLTGPFGLTSPVINLTLRALLSTRTQALRAAEAQHALLQAMSNG